MLTNIQNFLRWRRERRESDELRRRFSTVHKSGVWQGDGDTTSGLGSAQDSPQVIVSIELINHAVEEYGVRWINDIPCGDFHWQSLVFDELPDVDYHGFDIVPEVIDKNRQEYPRYKFSTLDIVNEVPPRADLIFCKDLLNHLSDAHVKKAIENMKRSGSTYLLASNNLGWENLPFPAEEGPSASRYLDITAAPFNYQKPFLDADDYLCFWRLSEIGECSF